MRQITFLLLWTFSLFSYEVVSYGDAIIDYIVFVEDEFLEKLPGAKGGSEQIDLGTFAALTKNFKIKSAGGSAPNTMRGLAYFGYDCAVIGRIGNDEDGFDYSKTLKAQGITPLFTPHNTPTGRVVCMISPDGHRTMRSCIGKLVGFEGFPVDGSLFKGAKLFHIEGYQIPNASFLCSLIGKAKKKGLSVSMDLGCHELVAAHKEVLTEIISTIDILFANEDEAKVLTGLSPKDACLALSKKCPTVVVTMGEHGGYIASKNELLHYDAVEAKLVDDTGAGDLFMSGFLHGVLRNESLQECARYGAEIAAKVIQVVGTELPPEARLGLVKQ